MELRGPGIGQAGADTHRSRVTSGEEGSSGTIGSGSG